MNIEHETNRNETVPLHKTNEFSLSDQTLDHVVGGLNPQPLPPGLKVDVAIPKFA